MTPKLTSEFSWIVHQPARLGMMMMLAEHPRRFMEFCDDMDMNKGSIVRHTEYLEAVGYLTHVIQMTTGRISRKVFDLTADGREALEAYYRIASEVTSQLGQVLTKS